MSVVHVVHTEDAAAVLLVWFASQQVSIAAAKCLAYALALVFHERLSRKTHAPLHTDMRGQDAVSKVHVSESALPTWLCGCLELQHSESCSTCVCTENGW